MTLLVPGEHVFAQSPPIFEEAIGDPLSVKADHFDSQWYGWQILTADALTLGAAFAATRFIDREDPYDPMRLGYTNRLALGLGSTIAPTIHLTRGSPRSAAGSYMLRVLVPMASAVILPSTRCLLSDYRPGCYNSVAPLAYFLGYVAAVGIDAGVLAKGPARPPWIAQERQWYGWQILIADVIVFGAASLVGSTAYQDDGVGGAGLVFATMGTAISALPAGIIHAVHGNWGLGAASAVIRFFGAPLLLAIPTMTRDCAGTGFSDCASDSFGFGAATNLLLVSAFDSLFFANKPGSSVRERSPTGSFYTPWIVPTSGGAMGGLTVSF